MPVPTTTTIDKSPADARQLTVPEMKLFLKFCQEGSHLDPLSLCKLFNSWKVKISDCHLARFLNYLSDKHYYNAVSELPLVISVFPRKSTAVCMRFQQSVLYSTDNFIFFHSLGRATSPKKSSPRRRLFVQG